MEKVVVVLLVVIVRFEHIGDQVVFAPYFIEFPYTTIPSDSVCKRTKKQKEKKQKLATVDNSIDKLVEKRPLIPYIESTTQP